MPCPRSDTAASGDMLASLCEMGGLQHHSLRLFLAVSFTDASQLSHPRQHVNRPILKTSQEASHSSLVIFLGVAHYLHHTTWTRHNGPGELSLYQHYHVTPEGPVWKDVTVRGRAPDVRERMADSILHFSPLKPEV